MNIQYRPEIDGLRAIAVLPVVFYHAGVPGFSGGYIGVDIFFVISGYLIGRILLEEMASGRFSLVQFYERRARRILPALVFLAAMTSVFAFVYFNPTELKRFAASLVAAATFTSNFYFLSISGYFDLGADQHPLLHTWSLAVEEQFYLVFPLILLVLGRCSGNVRVGVFAGLALASLAAAQQTVTVRPDAAFYLIYARGWELLTGVILAAAATPHNDPPRLAAVGCWTGLAAIVYAIVVFDYDTPVPGVHALIPVAGTALIIRFGRSKNLVTQVLNTRPLVGIGLISYSLYLWHFPAIVFLKTKTVGGATLLPLALVVGASGLIAYASWRWIEQPFRNRQLVSTRSVWLFSAATLLLVAAAGSTTFLSGGWPMRFAANPLMATAIPTSKRDDCHTSGADYLEPKEACRYYGSVTTWATLGDSHVAELSEALAERLLPADEGVLHLSFSACPPAYSFQTITAGCQEWLRAAVETVAQDSKIQNVIVGFRHVYYLYGNHAAVYPRLPAGHPSRFMQHSGSLTHDQAEEIYWRGYRDIIDALLSAGKRVIILNPVPEVPTDVRRAIHPYSIFSDRPLLDPQRSMPLDYYEKRNDFILRKTAELDFSDRLVLLDPREVLCGIDYCRTVIDGETMYFDDDHLSVAGARRVIALLDAYLP